MAQIWEYIKIALMNIRNNKGRSFLTMLGIIIGISSVIMIISIGEGVREEINSELDSIGSGQIYVYVDSTRKDTAIRFTDDDISYLKEKVDNVKGITASTGGWGTAEGPKGDYDAYIQAGNQDFQYTMSDPIIKGRYFTESDCISANRVCILTESGAKLLFGTTDVVGMSFDLTLYGITQEITIIGIRQDNASAFFFSGGMDRVEMEMPMTVMGNYFYYWVEDFSELLIIADSAEASAEVAKQSVKLLESKYDVRGENQILVQSFTDVSAQYDTILGMITLFISFVAAISLLVGGIGVMNIMLVSVTERTREIGIRKALGARTGSILMQFLAEAGIITLIGGLVGITLGFLGAILICSLIGFAAKVQIGTIIIATLFSCGVGIFFGIYPARKAARLSPIEALRHE